MITSNDIKTILYKEQKTLFPSVQLERDVHAPIDEGNNFERIVIVVPGGVENGIIARALPRICFYVPDLAQTSKNGDYLKPNTTRLSEIEKFYADRYACGIFGGQYEGLGYEYRLENITQEADPETWSHFINLQLNFSITNGNKRI